MSEGVKIALTALLGVAVFVVGQLLQRLFIEPIQEMRRTVGKIAHALTFYANFMPLTPIPSQLGGGGVVGKPPEKMEEASLEIRRMASDLRAVSLVIPWYRLFAFAKLVPSAAAIDVASQNLIGWSNSLGREPSIHRKEIAKALKLSIPGLYP